MSTSQLSIRLSIITLPEGVLYCDGASFCKEGEVKKLSNERYRVRFINVVPYLINGYGYRKPGSVVQKFTGVLL